MNYVEGTIFTLMVILHVQGPSFDMSLFQIYLISPQRGNTIQAFYWMSLFIKYIFNQTEHKLSPIHNFILVGTHCLFVFLFSCLFACLFVCLLVFLFCLFTNISYFNINNTKLLIKTRAAELQESHPLSKDN